MSCLWNSGSRLTLLSALALGCSPGEPIEPSLVGPLDIFLGDTTPTLTLAPGQLSREHHLTYPDNVEVAVFVQALDSAVRLRIFVDGIDMGVSDGLYAAEPRLLANRTERFPIAAGKTLNVFLSRQGTLATTPLRYRLFVYPVNRDPEHGAGTVVLDQVRSEEDLETSADIDEYALEGQQGKDLVGYLSNLGVGAAGSFSLGFYAAGNVNSLGGVSAPDVGVLLEDNATAPFTVPAGPHVVGVQGTSNLPSSYTFVIRQALPPSPAGVVW